jgi:hypothetical protein
LRRIQHTDFVAYAPKSVKNEEKGVFRTLLIVFKEKFMLKRKISALALCLAVSALCVTGAFAQVTVSGGLALSSVDDITVKGDGTSTNPNIDSDTGVGGNLFVDWLLPTGIPLSLGFEVGVDGAKFTVENYYNETMTAIPLLLRAAYHFDLHPKLDLYVVGKIGYVIGIWQGEWRDEAESSGATIEDPVGGFGFGIDAGVAWYFNSKVGVFAEVGFDKYALETKVKFPTEYQSGGVSYTLEAPFNRFLTAGISGKF